MSELRGYIVHRGEFRRAGPELAALGEERMEATGLVLLGTMRKNGSPRIPPVEPLLTMGRLYLGMMWQSRKALDLLRDPRCTVHSTVSDRHGSEGEFKLYGRGLEIRDLEERRLYGEVLNEKIGFKPAEPEFHLFAVHIESAAYAVIRDGEWFRRNWNAAGRS